MTGGPAALVLARAPDDPAALAGLGLGPARTAALQALLIRRAAAWAAGVAPGAAFVAVAPPASAGAGVDVAALLPADAPGAAPGAVEVVAALLPAGVTVLAAVAGGIAGAIARVGRGPLLVARADCPRLGPAHAAAALDDLDAGCDVVFGATLEGGWYLAGLRDPRADLLAAAPDARRRGGGLGPVLRRARELGAEVGMLRHERVLATAGDAAALVADPLVPAVLRAALSA